MFFVGNSGEKGNYTDHRAHIDVKASADSRADSYDADIDTAEGWVHSSLGIQFGEHPSRVQRRIVQGEV